MQADADARHLAFALPGANADVAAAVCGTDAAEHERAALRRKPSWKNMQKHASAFAAGKQPNEAAKESSLGTRLLLRT